MQDLDNQAALLAMALPQWLEEAEEHQVCIDLQQLPCAARGVGVRV